MPLWETLRNNCTFFKSEGFETGVWVWTIQFPEENAKYLPDEALEHGLILQGKLVPAIPTCT